MPFLTNKDIRKMEQVMGEVASGIFERGGAERLSAAVAASKLLLEADTLLQELDRKGRGAGDALFENVDMLHGVLKYAFFSCASPAVNAQRILEMTDSIERSLFPPGGGHGGAPARGRRYTPG